MKRGISTRRGIMAIHREPCYQNLRANLPATDWASQHTIAIPLYPSMTKNDVQYVIHNITELVET